MFERFTQDAREVVIRAQQEATELNHPTIGTEHLLLGMLTDPGPAGSVLREAGVDVDSARAAILIAVPGGRPLMTAEDAEALRSVGIDLDAVLARIEESFGPEAVLSPDEPRRGWLGRRRRPRARFGPRSKKAVELSLREAIRLHSKELSSGHLLLGLLREGSGLGTRILVDAGVDLSDLRTRTETSLLRAA